MTTLILPLLPIQDGVFIQGLFLEGAGWDRKNSCLVEAEPMQMVCPMPTIHFKPVERKKTAKSESSGTRSNCLAAVSVSLFRSTLSKVISDVTSCGFTISYPCAGMYQCPCYYFPVRSGGAGRASFVVSVELKSGAVSPEHWIKRGAALLMSLDSWRFPGLPRASTYCPRQLGCVVISTTQSTSTSSHPHVTGGSRHAAGIFSSGSVTHQRRSIRSNLGLWNSGTLHDCRGQRIK